MKNKNILFVLFLIFLFLCCKEKTYYSEIADVVKSELGDSLKDYDRVYVIPGSGCTGCINSAENFFLENVKNRKNKFILTYNFSIKNLALKLKKENLEQENVLIDTKNIFYLEKYKERIYPIALELEKGKISRIYNF
jgi:hypothetical protein